jgi:hypothetical protein
MPTQQNESISSDDDDTVDKAINNGDNINKRKRKPVLAPNNHKQHNRKSAGTRERNLKSAVCSGKRRKLSEFHKVPTLSRHSVPNSNTGTQDGNIANDDVYYGSESSGENSEAENDFDSRPQDDKRAVSIGSCSILSRDKDILSPHSSDAPPHTTGGIRPSLSEKVTSFWQSQKRLPDITLHPLSNSSEFLTAFIYNWNSQGTPTTQAAKLLKNIVSQSATLGSITVRPLAPDMCFLTCVVFCPFDAADRKMDWPAPTLRNISATKPDSAILQEDSHWSGDDDESVSDHKNEDKRRYLSDGNSSDEYSDVHEERPSNSSKGAVTWSKKEEDLLRSLKEQGHRWNYIHTKFRNRTAAAVKARWYMKLQAK